MALIEANALREYYKINELCEVCHWNKRDCSKPPYYSLHDICVAIDELPTIPAIPVDWIRKYADTVGSRVRAEIVREMLDVWQKEQEAR